MERCIDAVEDERPREGGEPECQDLHALFVPAASLFTRASRGCWHRVDDPTTLPMITASLLAGSVTIPAAVILTVGVLGVFDVRSRRRVSAHSAMTASGTSREPAHMPDNRAREWGDPGRNLEGDACVDARAAALRLVEEWSACPRSTWHALGVRSRSATRQEAGALAASQLILEGVLAHHASAIDAWIVRDAAETAWSMAPDDIGPLTSSIECAARRTVTNAALAVLADAWLPVEDLDRLTAFVMH